MFAEILTLRHTQPKKMLAKSYTHYHAYNKVARAILSLSHILLFIIYLFIHVNRVQLLVNNNEIIFLRNISFREELHALHHLLFLDGTEHTE